MLDIHQLNSRIFTSSPKRSTQHHIEPEVEEPQSNRMFLPVEAFDPLLDVEEPFETIDRFRNPATGMTIGFSKWNYPNGDAELRKCIVESYIKERDLYEIIWLHNL